MKNNTRQIELCRKCVDTIARSCSSCSDNKDSYIIDNTESSNVYRNNSVKQLSERKNNDNEHGKR